MLSTCCCNSGIWVWSLYESSMIVCRGNCGDLVKLDNRHGWAAMWVVVIWLIPVALGPEFLSLGPRWAYNSMWRYGTPVDWLTCLDLSMSYLVRASHLAYASKMFWNEMVEEVHTYRMWLGWRMLGGIELDPLHTTNGSASENGRSRDGGLEPFGVAHGIGQRKVKVVGGLTPLRLLARVQGTVVTCG
jgi:hypothetical protein